MEYAKNFPNLINNVINQKPLKCFYKTFAVRSITVIIEFPIRSSTLDRNYLSWISINRVLFQ